MMEKKEIITQSAKETQKAAADFIAGALSDDMKDKKAERRARLICLWGDLGSGKTTFTQGVAKKLGVKDVVNSPTFIIMKKYILGGKYKGMNLYHFDLYRLREKQELLDLGWGEILEDRNNMVMVEWPEKIAEILPLPRIDIKFKVLAESERIITFFE